MAFVEAIYIILFMALSIWASYSDCKTGIISNRVLFRFAIAGVVLDLLYYGFFVRDQWISALLNILIVCAISLYLFFSHTFAGGDCKLLIVLSILYPARFLLIYGSTDLTEIFALGISILLGYFYLLGDSVRMLVERKNRISREYIQKSVVQFLQSFFSASVYVSAVNMMLFLFASRNFVLNQWLSYLICVGVAWCSGKYMVLQKWYLVMGMFLLDLVVGGYIGVTPFSVHPENYILVLVLLICRMTINTNIYEQIAVNKLRSGMILSTFSSAMMQGSRVNGLPGISSEDLRNRLSQNEVESIVRWSKNRNVQSVSVVKKIPFALFISLGYFIYFTLWSLIQ